MHSGGVRGTTRARFVSLSPVPQLFPQVTCQSYLRDREDMNTKSPAAAAHSDCRDRTVSPRRDETAARMPEPEEMGGMPKSAGRSGASHSMTVNKTVIALIRPKPDLDLVTGGAGRNPGGRAGRRRRPQGDRQHQLLRHRGRASGEGLQRRQRVLGMPIGGSAGTSWKARWRTTAWWRRRRHRGCQPRGSARDPWSTPWGGSGRPPAARGPAVMHGPAEDHPNWPPASRPRRRLLSLRGSLPLAPRPPRSA